MDEKLIKRHRSTILQLYFVFVASLVGSFWPHMIVQAVALVFLLALIIAVPVYQAVAPAGSLLKNHMRYLNVTIWMSSLFLCLSILILGFWVFQQSDQSAFYTLFDEIANGTMVGEEQLKATFHTFMQANLPLLMKASVVCLAPPLIYTGWRVLNALSRAVHGYRMPSED